MSHQGDFALESTFDLKFTSRNFSTGAPFALSGGTIAAYPDNSTTEVTAGITLTADFGAINKERNPESIARFPAVLSLSTENGAERKVGVKLGTLGSTSLLISGHWNVDIDHHLVDLEAAAQTGDKFILTNLAIIGTGTNAVIFDSQHLPAILTNPTTAMTEPLFLAVVLWLNLLTIKCVSAMQKGSIPAYPFHATRYRPSSEPAGKVPDISGLWDIQAKSSNGESAWRLIIRQSGAEAARKTILQCL